MEKNNEKWRIILFNEAFFELGLNPHELTLLLYSIQRGYHNQIVWFTKKTKKKAAKILKITVDELESTIKSLVEKNYFEEIRQDIYKYDSFFYDYVNVPPECVDDYLRWEETLIMSNSNVEVIKKMAAGD